MHSTKLHSIELYIYTIHKYIYMYTMYIKLLLMYKHCTYHVHMYNVLYICTSKGVKNKCYRPILISHFNQQQRFQRV